MNQEQVRQAVFDVLPCKVNVFAAASELVAALADALETHLHQRLTLQTPKPLGLATGRTMEPVYQQLLARLLDWPAADLQKLQNGWLSFNLDEYVGLAVNDPRTFHSYMRRHFGDRLGLSQDRLRVPDGHGQDPQAAARRYGDQLNQAGGLGLQLLGLGSNGHVGFNEPPCGLDSVSRVVSLTQATRQQNAAGFDGNPAHVPAQAITVGLREILAADQIHLVVTGASKAEILEAWLRSPCTAELPASWLRSHANLHLWVDEAAIAGFYKNAMN
ncbi:MAG TPA: glucosamine-6-phosphate deaminase [Prochlorococcaceae cyanobacterium Fu_MAG_50]|nr:glucosamine-6-phosphate deaminase [Prochlorococcaceae cyanobacterium Fu_MAG_50]